MQCPKAKCFNCGVTGHVQADCKVCGWCGAEGHASVSCPKHHGVRKESRRNPTAPAPVNASVSVEGASSSSSSVVSVSGSYANALSGKKHPAPAADPIPAAHPATILGYAWRMNDDFAGLFNRMGKIQVDLAQVEVDEAALEQEYKRKKRELAAWRVAMTEELATADRCRKVMEPIVKFLVEAGVEPSAEVMTGMNSESYSTDSGTVPVKPRADQDVTVGVAASNVDCLDGSTALGRTPGTIDKISLPEEPVSPTGPASLSDSEDTIMLWQPSVTEFQVVGPGGKPRYNSEKGSVKKEGSSPQSPSSKS